MNLSLVNDKLRNLISVARQVPGRREGALGCNDI